MDNVKPSELLDDGVSSEMSTDESVISKQEEALPEDCLETAVSAEKQETEECMEDLNFSENNPSVDGADGKIETMIQQLIEQVSNMETLFNKRIMHTDYEDKVIDQMHSELQKYKEDLYSQLVRPILLDIIDVRDSIMRIASTYLKKPEGEQDIPNKIFADYAFDMQDILERNNVEIYMSEKGDAFVPVEQRAVKKEITNDESLHGKVAESLSSGYRYGERVLSAEKVSVYFYQALDEEKNESEENLNG